MKKVIVGLIIAFLIAVCSVIGYNIGVGSQKQSIADSYTKGYQSGQVSILSAIPKDVSYAEVKKFVAQDRTNEGEYDKYEYNCVDFANSLRDNALKNGIVCGFVVLSFKDAGGFGHSLNAFNTTDKGIIYVEPQNDVFITEGSMSTGNNYWDKASGDLSIGGMWTPYHGYATRNESYIDRVEIIW